MNIQNSPGFGGTFLVEYPTNWRATNRIIKDFKERDEKIRLYESSGKPNDTIIVQCDKKDDRNIDYYLKHDFLRGTEVKVTKFNTVI